MRATLTCALAVLLAAGCGDSKEPRVYRAPKDTPSPLQAAGGGHEHDHDHAPAAPQWVVPAGWKRLPDQQMRFATFQVDPEDSKLNVIVYAFGPESGPVLPNVNRWEGQIGATPSTEATLSKVVTRLKNNGLEIDSVDLHGPAPEGASEGVRMLAAIIPAGGQVWFLKFVGPESKIAAHKAEYDAFLKSLAFEGGGPSKPPGGGESKLRKYDLPPGWTLDPEPRPMRVATFRVKADGQEAEVIVSSISGEQSGTQEANVNRWRAQVGLGPVTDLSTVRSEPVTVGDVKGTLLDFGGPDDPAPSGKRALVVQAQKGGSLWYFKLTGPAALVAGQKKGLVDFARSLEFGE